MRWLLSTLVVVLAWQMYIWLDISLYEITTSIRAVQDLLNLPKEDVDKAKAAWAYLQNSTWNTNTEVETEHVRNMYTVLHHMLALAGIEKMYIPPELDARQGVFGNQLLAEERLVDLLHVGSNSTILEVGCGRGRIAHHAARLTGGKVFGFNIDESQIKEAKAHAEKTGLADRLDFKIGDHHKRFQYDDGTFDGVYTIQGMWPFFKTAELEGVANELFRVLKPGARFSAMDYVVTRDFDRNDAHHMRLHALWMPTLCAFQSNYPTEITDALKRAGFEILLSAPSLAPSWPLSVGKTALFHNVRLMAAGLTHVGLVGPWLLTLLDSLMGGGEAYYAGEKAKLMDINWRIVARKPSM